MAKTKIYEVSGAASNAQVLHIPVATVGDPTGGAVSHAIVPRGQRPVAGDLVAGTWGAWDAAAGEAPSYTDTVGGSSATTNVSRLKEWDVYVSFVVGSETPLEKVGLLRVI